MKQVRPLAGFKLSYAYFQVVILTINSLQFLSHSDWGLPRISRFDGEVSDAGVRDPS